MSNILDIPQIASFDLANIQNDLHIGFGGDIAKRLQTDQAYREMVLMVNAQAIATSVDDEASTLNYTYTELIKSVQETIKYYRQISDERRRANKRVTVKSDIVGNHQYQTVAIG